MRLVQIVPSLPPVVEGVGGYAAVLGEELTKGGMTSSFIVGDPLWPGGLAVPADLAGGAAALTARSPAALLQQLEDTRVAVVLLHYVNYGYAGRGCPRWLVEGVARWRRRTGGTEKRRLVTYFHEVYASGPPWHSSFWTHPVQRLLAKRLLRRSDGAGTSLALYAGILARWRPSPTVAATPVFSTVGEPATVPPPGERRLAMVVFGGAGNRRRVYRELGHELVAACHGLGIEEIVDLGPRLAEVPDRLAGLPVRQRGVLPPTAASEVLLGSYAGFLGYPPSFLAKSTVYAAYCAHGLVPVCAWPRHRRERAGARPPFWDPASQPPPSDAASLAARARTWYGDHDLASQALQFQALLTGVAGLAGEREPILSATGRPHLAAPLPAAGRRPPPA
jgi:hypothetical protein